MICNATDTQMMDCRKACRDYAARHAITQPVTHASFRGVFYVASVYVLGVGRAGRRVCCFLTFLPFPFTGFVTSVTGHDSGDSNNPSNLHLPSHIYNTKW